MKEIPLTRGKVAIVDDEDYEALSKHKWCCRDDGYACRNTRRINKHGNQGHIFMHREVYKLMDGEFCDHINGNKLDNRRENLRKATISQNAMNKKAPTNNTSGFKGVYWNKRDNNWHSMIMINNKSIYLGAHQSKEEAAYAYNKKAKEIFGEFARLNVIGGGKQW